MKALDMNVLVRLLTNDDPAQAKVAADEMRQGQVFISVTALLETEWVLRHAYGFQRERVNAALQALADLSNATVQDEKSVRDALRWHSAGMDFADALHLAGSGRAAEMITFDRQFAARRRGMEEGLPVRLLTV